MKISVLVPVRDDPRIDDLLVSRTTRCRLSVSSLVNGLHLIPFLPMGPVWRLMKGGKAACDRCGREIEDHPAVGRVVDFQFQPLEHYCWDCYRYISPFVDEVSPESSTPFQPVTKPALP